MSLTGMRVATPDVAPVAGGRLLENEWLRVRILPERGGKIVSLEDKRSGTEWLLPPLRPYEDARSDRGFEQWDGGGFDECLPSVSETDKVPDHGEVWRNTWTEESIPGAIAVSATACQGGIRLRRNATLRGTSLLLDYSVENESKAAHTLLYSAHPLLQVQQGDRLELPAEVKTVRIDSSSGGRMGAKGAVIAWTAQQGMGMVGPPDGTQADKLFAGPLRDGWCRLMRPSTGEALTLHFDTHVLPYLGIWICRAAWPEQSEKKQYTVAFEPTSADCDSLAEAERDNTAWRLAPGEKRAWKLRFEITASPSNGGAQHMAARALEGEL